MFLRDYLNHNKGAVKPINSLSMIIRFLDTEGSYIDRISELITGT